jgi:hypothetical protein
MTKAERPRAKTCGEVGEYDVLLKEILEENRLLKTRNEELEQKICLLGIEQGNRRNSFVGQRPLTPPLSSSPRSVSEEDESKTKRRFEGSATRDLILLRRPSEEQVFQYLSGTSWTLIYLRFYLALMISVLTLVRRGPSALKKAKKFR